jgi:hypothetical protein
VSKPRAAVKSQELRSPSAVLPKSTHSHYGHWQIGNAHMLLGIARRNAPGIGCPLMIVTVNEQKMLQSAPKLLPASREQFRSLLKHVCFICIVLEQFPFPEQHVSNSEQHMCIRVCGFGNTKPNALCDTVLVHGRSTVFCQTSRSTMFCQTSGPNADLDSKNGKRIMDHEIPKDG